ncbi:hypothetical protein B5M45_17970 [Mycobacterium simiae]|uniref:Uncharacterized protein n=1 Tax=Mycobacterium simiae TaxID=1784 RepID=A0A1X0Y0L4_MYCSI|nr:hypothetical protein B5M45_17970 [Mycobacterium simiae]
MPQNRTGRMNSAKYLAAIFSQMLVILVFRIVLYVCLGQHDRLSGNRKALDEWGQHRGTSQQ